jgi:hypothetical protein
MHFKSFPAAVVAAVALAACTTEQSSMAGALEAHSRRVFDGPFQCRG